MPSVGSFQLYSSSLLESLQSYSDIPIDQWNNVVRRAGSGALAPSWRSISQRLQFPQSSDDNWIVTPDSLLLLQHALNGAVGNAVVVPVLQITETFNRPGPAGSQTVSVTNSVALTQHLTETLAGTLYHRDVCVCCMCDCVGCGIVVVWRRRDIVVQYYGVDVWIH